MITVGILAYNEEENLQRAVNTVLTAAKAARQKNIDILIVNDGSTDKTGEIAAALQKKHKNIRYIDHGVNKGLGATIQTIIQNTKYDKLCFIPGDDVLSLDTITNFFTHANKADLIFYYYINTEDRLRSRIILSTFYTLIHLLVFDVHLKYINGSGIYSASLLKRLNIRSTGYNISAEMNVKSVLSGASYHEVAGYLKPNSTKSNALRLKNVIKVFAAFFKLWYEVKIRDRKRYSEKRNRVF